MKNYMFDIVIIGAGVSGCSVARELSKYKLNIAVLEKNEDVCTGTSKANSGIVHAGFDAEPDSLMAKLNVKGNAMMDKLSKDLDFDFQRIGSLVVCNSQGDTQILYKLKEQGEKNGVKGLQILDREELFSLEPNLADNSQLALFAPSGGIVCPFSFNIALAENAFENGVQFFFNTPVDSVSKDENGYEIKSNDKTFSTKCVVNAAGVYADVIHNMISDERIEIIPRKGEYMLLDKSENGYVKHTVFTLPSKYGKGVLVSPTTHGNIIVGPTANDIDDKEYTDTTAEGLKEVRTKANAMMKNLPLNKVITSFAGIRAHEKRHDFRIEEVKGAPLFFDCAAIESPGLSSAPAIGEYLCNMICKKLNPEKKDNFISKRKGILNPFTLSKEEFSALVKEKPEYGKVVCRCESVTEGQIIDAIKRPLGAKTIDGIKRRTRAGLGRCQSGFCLPKTLEILSRETGMEITEIDKCGENSEFLQD